jgi:hypothetical protein
VFLSQHQAISELSPSKTAAPATSQPKKGHQMTIRIGDTAPNFQADTTNRSDRFSRLDRQSWVFFFSHPADFTPGLHH